MINEYEKMDFGSFFWVFLLNSQDRKWTNFTFSVFLCGLSSIDIVISLSLSCFVFLHIQLDFILFDLSIVTRIKFAFYVLFCLTLFALKRKFKCFSMTQLNWFSNWFLILILVSLIQFYIYFFLFSLHFFLFTEFDLKSIDIQH